MGKKLSIIIVALVVIVAIVIGVILLVGGDDEGNEVDSGTLVTGSQLQAAVTALGCEQVEAGDVFSAYSCQVDGSDYNLVETVDGNSEQEEARQVLCQGGALFLMGDGFRIHGQPTDEPNNNFDSLIATLDGANISTSVGGC